MSYSNPMYYVGVSAIHIKRSCIANKITVAAGTESHFHVHCTTVFLSDLIRYGIKYNCTAVLLFGRNFL